MHKYSVIHKVAIAYHPQMNVQAELENREIEQILEKIGNLDHEDWSLGLLNVPWAYYTT